jgi:hypothetical protein
MFTTRNVTAEIFSIGDGMKEFASAALECSLQQEYRNF